MNTVVEIRDYDENVLLTTERVQMDRQKRSEILLNIAGALLLVSIIVLLFFLINVRSTKIKPVNVPPDLTFDRPNITDFVLKIMPRDFWKAQEPRHLHTNLIHPVNRILIGHTGFNECREQDVCSQELLKLQTFYTDTKHLDDIGWNFMIGADGTVYQGCGWDYEGFHTLGYNADSIGIAFIGKFSKNSPTEECFLALHFLIEKGVRVKKIAHDYRLFPQRAFLPRSDSPGKKVIDVIKNWPHFKYRMY